MKIKLAVLGGNRGGAFKSIIEYLKDNVELTALCDPNKEIQTQWKTMFPEIKLYDEYTDLLEAGNADAILIATPLPLHCDHSIMALEAGCHVLSEVTAVATIEEGYRLIEAVEKSGKTYMMAENSCYTKTNLIVKEMAKAGLFGELLYAEGHYVHDIRDYMLDSKGQTNWRGRFLTGEFKSSGGNFYPTHPLGPISWWFGLNSDDKMESLVTMASGPGPVKSYVEKTFGKDLSHIDPMILKAAATSTTLIKTEKGRLINLRFDVTSPRPPSHYMQLQGTKGAFTMPIEDKNPFGKPQPGDHDGKYSPLVWIDGKSPGITPANYPDADHAKWESLFNYSDQYQNSIWNSVPDELVAISDHGGCDCFPIVEFIRCIEEKKPSPIDVYDAVSWSSIMELSAQSVAGGSIPVKIPNFKKEVKNG